MVCLIVQYFVTLQSVRLSELFSLSAFSPMVRIYKPKTDNIVYDIQDNFPYLRLG